MVRYADSSVFVCLYCPETFSVLADREIRRSQERPVFNELHQLEVRNAIRGKVPRGQATRAEVAAFLQSLDTDISVGLWIRMRVNWPLVLAKAEDLSSRFTPALNARSLDILHVAIAVTEYCTEFITADAKQAKLADAAGLSSTFIGTIPRGNERESQ
jgi:predicted nucleic acid-binding protein